MTFSTKASFFHLLTSLSRFIVAFITFCLHSYLHNCLFCTLFFYSLIFGCSGSLVLCGLFSSCREQRLLSSHTAWASHRSGFSCCGAQALGHVDFSSCGLGLVAPWHVGFSRTRIKPASPALAGRFFTTEIARKPFSHFRLSLPWGMHCVLSLRFSSVASQIHSVISKYVTTQVKFLPNFLNQNAPIPLTDR